MAFPWTVEFTWMHSGDDDAYHETFAQGYHLEEIVRQVQSLLHTHNPDEVFVKVPTGADTVTLKSWAEMLSRNYLAGEHEQPFDLYDTTIINKTVVMKRAVVDPNSIFDLN